MYHKIKLIAFLVFNFSFAYSQEGIPVYSDYLSDNYYLIHPSMAGIGNCAKLRLTSRKQWLGEEDAPSLQTLSFNGLIDDRSAAGIILFNDKNGFHSQKGVKLTYAYHIHFTRDEIDLNQLSLGINAGLIENQLNETSFKIFDPIIYGSMQKESYFNIDFGASYNYRNFYAHATVQGAIETRRKIYTEFESDNLRKYLFSLGYIFGKENKLLWEPSILYQAFDKTKERQVDLNLKLHKNLSLASVWLALSYRVNFDKGEYFDVSGVSVPDKRVQYITPIFGINYKNFMFAYTYSKIIGNVEFDETPYHQFTLGINLFCKKSGTIVTVLQ